MQGLSVGTKTIGVPFGSVVKIGSRRACWRFDAGNWTTLGLVWAVVRMVLVSVAELDTVFSMFERPAQRVLAGCGDGWEGCLGCR